METAGCRYKNECPSRSGWCGGPKQDFSRCIPFLITAYEGVKEELGKYENTGLTPEQLLEVIGTVEKYFLGGKKMRYLANVQAAEEPEPEKEPGAGSRAVQETKGQVEHAKSAKQEQGDNMAKEYTWSKSKSDETWMHDRFDSAEECIRDAAENHGMGPGDEIAVGICEDYTPRLDAAAALDRASEDAYEECGEVAEGWPCCTKADISKLQEKLDKAFSEWLEETNNKPGFYHVRPLAGMFAVP